jgi:hypothetical protein
MKPATTPATGHRHHQHVPMGNVGQLVTEYPLDFLHIEAAKQPVVTHTTARLGLRPVAKALGMSVSTMHPRFGHVCQRAGRSPTSCSCGTCSAVTRTDISTARFGLNATAPATAGGNDQGEEPADPERQQKPSRPYSKPKQKHGDTIRHASPDLG